jgi:hypothetical protein
LSQAAVVVVDKLVVVVELVECAHLLRNFCLHHLQ